MCTYLSVQLWDLLHGSMVCGEVVLGSLDRIILRPTRGLTDLVTMYTHRKRRDNRKTNVQEESTNSSRTAGSSDSEKLTTSSYTNHLSLQCQCWCQTHRDRSPWGRTCTRCGRVQRAAAGPGPTAGDCTAPHWHHKQKPSHRLVQRAVCLLLQDKI